MKSNSVHHHYPSGERTAAEDFAILFVSTPSCLHCYWDVFLNHTQVSHQEFHLKPRWSMQREDSWPITLWKGKDPEVFFVFSIGGWKVLWLPSLPPSKASWAPLTPWERGTDFQGLVGQRIQHPNIWKALRSCCPRVKHGETMTREWVCLCVCVFCREWLNCTDLWVRF